MVPIMMIKMRNHQLDPKNPSRHSFTCPARRAGQLVSQLTSALMPPPIITTYPKAIIADRMWASISSIAVSLSSGGGNQSLMRSGGLSRINPRAPVSAAPCARLPTIRTCGPSAHDA